jgi:predicted methyltransferase
MQEEDTDLLMTETKIKFTKAKGEDFVPSLFVKAVQNNPCFMCLEKGHHSYAYSYPLKCLKYGKYSILYLYVYKTLRSQRKRPHQ